VIKSLNFLKKLEDNQNIESLNIGSNLIVSDLQGILESNIINLEIPYNAINDQGLLVLSEYLQRNKVKKLDIEGNKFSIKDLKNISKEIINNTSLEYLEIGSKLI
jgi:Ran GTPase-activating protein (RanGAP) involved in mRNA processing and transport